VDQSIAVVKEAWVHLEANFVMVALSKEVNRLELLQSKEVNGWNRERSERVLKISNKSALFYSSLLLTMQVNRIMIGDGREPK